MAKKSIVSVRASGATPVDPADEFSAFALEEAEDNRILRASLWFAVVFHTLLLLINFPAFDSQPAADPGDRVVHAYEIKRYVRRIPPPDYIPPKRVMRKPMPDETPHEPEPIRLDEPQARIELPEVDPDAFVIPDAPPAPPEPDGPIAVVGEVTRPVKVHAPPPAYTEPARKARIQGVVIVQAIIDKKGDVTNVRLLKGLSMGLSENAISAIKQWKFKPATLRGKPVDVYYNLTVNFRLSS